MATKVVLKKRQATFKFSDDIAAPNTTNTLYDQITDEVTGGVTAWLEEFTITLPEGAIEKIDFCGETGGFQNMSLVPGPWDVGKATMKFVTSPVDTDKDIIGLLYSDGTGTTITSGEKRYQFGSSSTTTREAKAIGFEFTDGTNIIDVGLNKFWVTSASVTLEGNRYVTSIEGICLPADFYWAVQAA